MDNVAMTAPTETQSAAGPHCGYSDWRLWCRLCARDDLQGNINVFLKNEHAGCSGREGDLALATAIGKYFWVNITRGEELPEMICSECLTLVTSLVNFSERITRVQKLYCILQSSPKESVNLLELRNKFGLQEDEEQEEACAEAEESLTEPAETLTEVHYVEEKPKLNELDEETTLELENPLTPCPEHEESSRTDDKQEEEEEVEEQEQQEKKELQQEEEEEEEGKQEDYEDACSELLLNLSDACSNASSSAGHSTRPSRTPRTTTGSRGKAHQCSECPRAYALPQTLQRHMRQEHHQPQDEASSKQLPCEQCDKVFRSRYQLQRHQQQHLPLPKRKLYPCGSCGKRFTTSASAQSHAQYMHQEQERPRPVICEQCGVAVHSLNALKEHLLSHTDYAPFECDVCQKCFKSLSRLKHHKETHDPHKYVCPECGMQLNSRPTLNRHRLVHTDHMQHKCDYCGRQFKRAKALKNHLILHTGLKPYACDFCERTFANGSNCRTHKKKSHPVELAAQEAAGGARSYNRNIPKLEALKAFTKNKDNLSPVATKQSGCFAFGRKPKPKASAAEATAPALDGIYHNLIPQTQAKQAASFAADPPAASAPAIPAVAAPPVPDAAQLFSF
ncbi:hypothetical protein KR222_005368 [Zaprionus bogoriensis]|nr:hypothetical protein KR222_005368 [Zaprionus bogoriensis]